MLFLLGATFFFASNESTAAPLMLLLAARGAFSWGSDVDKFTRFVTKKPATSPCSMNQIHLEIEGTKYVAYEKSQCCRGDAWNHLLLNPPPGVVFPQRVPFRDVNPYRNSHTEDQWRWRILNEVPAPPSQPVEVRFFDPQIWKSTSNKYRMVARLPEGMTGKQAVQWAHEEYEKLYGPDNAPDPCWSENCAASHFMRCYTNYPFAAHCHAELTREEWDAFRRAGGQSA